MPRIITLTTDFGLADGYAGTLKGVILGINPGVTLVDIAHQINPQDVLDAAFVLGTSYHYFPSDTIHLVIVDPGVGSERAAIALRTPSGTFVGPDNGVFTWPINDNIGGAEGSMSGRRQLPSDGALKAVKLTESKFWLKSLSRTFHGRDVFAPVAAHLSLSVPLESLGEETSEVRVLPLPIPRKVSPTRIDGEVLKVDHFGNLITNFRAGDVQNLGDDVAFHIAGREIRGLTRYYQEQSGPLAIIGSSGYVEIALRNQSAAQVLGLGRGEPVAAMKARRGVPLNAPSSREPSR